MKAAYVDSSCLVAIEFDEAKSPALRRRLRTFDLLIASNLLEAELCAALAREGVTEAPQSQAAISWVMPDRQLSAEIARVLGTGYASGADCWHLATALFVSPDPAALTFLTLDERQRKVAAALGFKT